MARLPKPGGDDGTWGSILNTFLKTTHNDDGTLKPISQSKIIDLTDDLETLQTAVDSKVEQGPAATTDGQLLRWDAGDEVWTPIDGVTSRESENNAKAITISDGGPSGTEFTLLAGDDYIGGAVIATGSNLDDIENQLVPHFWLSNNKAEIITPRTGSGYNIINVSTDYINIDTDKLRFNLPTTDPEDSTSFWLDHGVLTQSGALAFSAERTSVSSGGNFRVLRAAKLRDVDNNVQLVVGVEQILDGDGLVAGPTTTRIAIGDPNGYLVISPESDDTATTMFALQDGDVRMVAGNAEISVQPDQIDLEFNSQYFYMNDDEIGISNLNVYGRLDATRVVGTSLATTGTVNLDMSDLNGTIQRITLTGNPTFTTSNRAEGRELTLVIKAGASGRTITWPSWTPLGAALPTSLASGKTMVLSLTFMDSTDAEALAAVTVQP